MFKKGMKKMSAGPSPDVSDRIAKRKKGMGVKKIPHPKTGKKKLEYQNLGTPELNF